VLVRLARVERLRRDGLLVREGSATRTYRPRVLTAPELGPEFDLVVLAVKSEAIGSAIDDVAPAVGPSTAVVPFLNGMRHVEPLVSRFGSAVLGGVLRIATELEDDGTIQVLAPMFEVEIGELARESGQRVEEIAARFRAAGAQVTVPPDIVGAMWEKWVFIASIGASTSLMRATVGEIVAYQVAPPSRGRSSTRLPPRRPPWGTPYRPPRSPPPSKSSRAKAPRRPRHYRVT
jgi:2-dehydropantoate 2-reductase